MRTILAAASGVVLLDAAACAQVSWISYPGPTFAQGSAPHHLVYDTARNRLLAIAFAFPAQASLEVEVQQRIGIAWHSVGGPVPVPNVPFAQAQGPKFAAYDGLRDRVVVVSQFAGVIEWDGNSWIVPPVARPSIEVLAGCYDAGRQVSLIVGRDLNQPNGIQTWQWNGSVWTQLVLQQELPQDFQKIAYDASSGRAVALSAGGTWALTAGAWSVVAAPPYPAFVLVNVFDYDGSASQLVCGGIGGTALWSGSSWSVLPNGGFFSGGGSSASTPFGVVAQGPGLSTLLGVRQPTAALTNIGPGCPGALGPINLVPSLPVVYAGSSFGGSFEYSIAGVSPLFFARYWVMVGLSRTQAGVLPLPLDLTALGMPGCSLRVSVDMLLGPTSGSTAMGGIAIPGTYEFLGLPFYVQALVQDFGPNGAVMAVSDAFEGIIGVHP